MWKLHNFELRINDGRDWIARLKKNIKEKLINNDDITMTTTGKVQLPANGANESIGESKERCELK